MIVGLGNPGSRYAATRHNVGFRVVESLARCLQVNVHRREGQALTGRTMYHGLRLLVTQPQTFMNESGRAVRSLADYYKIPPERILIVYDDLDLPPGRLRFRSKGSAGGHNGMRSVIQYLGTDMLPRLRIGIGAVPAGMRGMDYVLSPFNEDEAPLMTRAYGAAVDAVFTWLLCGSERAMAQINGLKEFPGDSAQG